MWYKVLYRGTKVCDEARNELTNQESTQIDVTNVYQCGHGIVRQNVHPTSASVPTPNFYVALLNRHRVTKFVFLFLITTEYCPVTWDRCIEE